MASKSTGDELGELICKLDWRKDSRNPPLLLALAMEQAEAPIGIPDWPEKCQQTVVIVVIQICKIFNLTKFFI